MVLIFIGDGACVVMVATYKLCVIDVLIVLRFKLIMKCELRY